MQSGLSKHLSKLIEVRNDWYRLFGLLTVVLMLTLPTVFLARSFGTEIGVFCLVLAAARILRLAADEGEIASRRAESGGKAEIQVQEHLSRELPGWHMQCNEELGMRGDVDIFLRSPKRNYFAIEVKSHRGLVKSHGDELVDAHGQPFEKKFLKQAMDNAIGIKEKENLKFVTPVLVFTRANLQLECHKIKNVIVLPLSDLTEFLISEDNRRYEIRNRFISARRTENLSDPANNIPILQNGNPVRSECLQGADRT